MLIVKRLMEACALMLMLLAPFQAYADTETTESVTPGFAEIINSLPDASYSEKREAVKKLSSLDDERVIDVFKAFLDSKLYYLDKDNTVIYVQGTDDHPVYTTVLDAKVLNNIDEDSIDRIRTNNSLRSMLRKEIATLNLRSKKEAVRLAAVKELIQKIDAESAVTLRGLVKTEKSARVKEAMEIAIAMMDVGSENDKIRLAAIKTLTGSLVPEVKYRLTSVLSKDQNGEYEEKSLAVRSAAESALKLLKSRENINKSVETLFFGLSLGSVLLLSAIGLAITFGVMGVINMAHGELMMLGAYTTYMVQQIFPDSLAYSLFIAIPAAFVVSGLFGIVIERGVIRFLYGRPLETLLATFGISLILQQLVRTTISAQNVIVSTPAWMSGSLQVNPILSLTYNRLYIFIFSLIVFAVLVYVLQKTILGLQVRAVSQNRNMAKAMGVRSDWVDALTFGLGSGIAGIAGVALSQLTNVGPNMGQSYIIDSFMVVVFGGVGNLWGTLVGALSLGVVNKVLEPWSGAVLAKILVLVFIILFIQKKPRGLFPMKGRSAEN